MIFAGVGKSSQAIVSQGLMSFLATSGESLRQAAAPDFAPESPLITGFCSAISIIRPMAFQKSDSVVIR